VGRHEARPRAARPQVGPSARRRRRRSRSPTGGADLPGAGAAADAGGGLSRAGAAGPARADRLRRVARYGPPEGAR
jgi:hypothetical protein